MEFGFLNKLISMISVSLSKLKEYYLIIANSVPTVDTPFSVQICAIFIFAFILICVIAYSSSKKTVRANSKAQSAHIKKANKAIKRILRKDNNYEEILKQLDGFTFEVFVLLGLQKLHKNIKKVDSIKLTNDGGIDGAFSLNGIWYIIQSKHYSGAVRTTDIEAIGRIAQRYETSQHPFAIKQRKKNKIDKVRAIFATSGYITPSGVAKAKDLNVHIMHAEDLVVALRKNRPIF